MNFGGRTFSGTLFLACCLCCFSPVYGIAQGRTSNAVMYEPNDGKLAEAAKALHSGDLAKAEILLRKLLAEEPRNASAHILAGITADRKNDLPTAEKHFALAAKLSPANAEARNNYGAILLKTNRPKEAVREFNASLAANPDQLSALVNLAQIRVAGNDLAAARSLFERAKAISADADVLRSLLLISLRLKETERAAGEFDEYFEKRRSLPPAATSNDWQTETALGEALLENGLLIEAQKEFEFILAKSEANTDSIVFLSKVYLRQKNIRAAGRLLESAVAGGRVDGRIYLALSDVYQSGGYFENAIPAMRLAVEQDPKNEFYRARYGLLLIDSKAPAAAIIRLNEALKEFPRSSRLWLTLGIAQQADGKSVDARRSFERAVQIEPASVAALAYLATSQIEQAQYAEALQSYRRALGVDEQNAVLHYLLADTMLKIPTSDPAEVRKHLERAVQIDPKVAEAHFALGKLYARDENWTKALAEFEQTVSYAPELAEAYYQLGRTLARLKRIEESRSAFEKHKKFSESQTAQKETHRQDLLRRLADVRF